MRKTKRMPSVQFPGSLFGGFVDDRVETNIHVVAPPPNGKLTVRRLQVSSAIQKDDLLQTVCSVLRTRYKLVAIPSPFSAHELLLAPSVCFERTTVANDDFRAEVQDIGQTLDLRFEIADELLLLSRLLEKAMVMELESNKNFWRASGSARFWYSSTPSQTAEGVQVIPRLSFAVMALPGNKLGVALDVGHLFRSESTVAYFFDKSVGNREQELRRRRFDKLRYRDAGRKGTLLYETGKRLITTCYFERFEPNVTCAAVLNVQREKSLFDYCRKKYGKPIAPDDPVAYVRFKGFKHAVPVPANWLRLRLSLGRDQMPRYLRQSIAISPEQRRRSAIANWKLFGPTVLSSLGFQDENRLWNPASEHRERLKCPILSFGQGRIVAPPAKPTVDEYRRYYRERWERLRRGGAFRFEPHVDRTVYVVTPRWDDAIEQQFTRDMQFCLNDVTGLNFRLQSVRANTPEEAIDRLHQFRPGSAIIVFDPATTDQAAYALLSYELRHWTIKRLLRNRVASRWEELQRSNGDARAQRSWMNAIELSVLDILDQMGTTLWRIDNFGYDACFAIDVGQDRRHFAVSLLIAREQSQNTSFMRFSRAWPKADHQFEQINAEVLAKSFMDIAGTCRNRAISPMRSVLVLRDGHQCGDENKGIEGGLEVWRKEGLLQGTAHIDVVDVQKHSQRGVRLWSPGNNSAKNVLEGQAIYPSDAVAILCCTGASSLAHDMTADPCVLTGQGGANIRRAAQAFFSMAQLNYSTPAKPHRLAQPLREVDTILEDCQSRNMRGIR